MNGYDIDLLNEEQLTAELKKMAKAWGNQRGLCHDFGEGIRYGNLTRALKERFGVDSRIDIVDHPDDFRLLFE